MWLRLVCSVPTVNLKNNTLNLHSGILSEIVIPKYDVCNYSAVQELRLVRVLEVPYGGGRVRTRVWSGVVEGCAGQLQVAS